MKKVENPQTSELQSSEKKARRPYERPDFITSLAFERQALSCAGCLNQAMGPPAFCSMQS